MKGQTSIEYLLLLSGVIVAVLVVATIMLGGVNEGGDLLHGQLGNFGDFLSDDDESGQGPRILAPIIGSGFYDETVDSITLDWYQAGNNPDNYNLFENTDKINGDAINGSERTFTTTITDIVPGGHLYYLIANWLTEEPPQERQSNNYQINVCWT
ncbi:MAG: class III signal peptide-containing protein, partial [archaeon]